MATTYNAINFFTGDGETKVFAFSFPYLSKEHVKVTQAGTALVQGTDFSITDEQVTLGSAPATSAVLKIYRETPTSRVITWSDGNYLLARNMTVDQLQTLYILQEQQDLAKLNNIADSGDGYFDAVTKQIKNVADPTADQDVVTKKYMETVSDGFVAESTTIQNDVKSRQTDIIARQTDVTNKQANVATMKTSVETSQADVTTKQSDVATMKTSVEASQADVTAKQSNVATMKTSVEASQADVTAKQSDVATMKTSVEASQADVTTKQANVATMKTSVETSQADVITKQANVATMESNVEALQSKFNIPTQIYPGTILPWGSDTIPYGYLLCDGSAISRTTYSELFAQIGTTFGSGDGSTTFNVPDLRNKTIVGKGTSFATLGGTGGETTHILTEAEMPNHAHSTSNAGDHQHYIANDNENPGSVLTNSLYMIRKHDNGSSENYELYGSNAGAWIGLTNNSGIHTHSITSTGGNAEHNNMPPYMVMNWIIKYTVVGKSNADALYLQRNTAYTAGEVILGATNLSKQYVLICTTAGTTGTSDVTTWGAVNDTTTDGTAMFVTRPASEILPVINVSTTRTLNNYELESMVVLSGSTTYTLTLPVPTTAGHTVSIRNAGSVAMILSTPSGIFDGPNGSVAATMSLPANVVCRLMSNGTNWVVESYSYNPLNTHIAGNSFYSLIDLQGGTSATLLRGGLYFYPPSTLSSGDTIQLVEVNTTGNSIMMPSLIAGIDFQIGATQADMANNIVSAFNANTTINTLYTASITDSPRIKILENLEGGGHTPLYITYVHSGVTSYLNAIPPTLTYGGMFTSIVNDVASLTYINTTYTFTIPSYFQGYQLYAKIQIAIPINNIMQWIDIPNMKPKLISGTLYYIGAQLQIYGNMITVKTGDYLYDNNSNVSDLLGKINYIGDCYTRIILYKIGGAV